MRVLLLAKCQGVSLGISREAGRWRVNARVLKAQKENLGARGLMLVCRKHGVLAMQHMTPESSGCWCLWSCELWGYIGDKSREAGGGRVNAWPWKPRMPSKWIIFTSTPSLIHAARPRAGDVMSNISFSRQWLIFTAVGNFHGSG
jgi:hypothetical protein